MKNLTVSFEAISSISGSIFTIVSLLPHKRHQNLQSMASNYVIQALYIISKLFFVVRVVLLKLKRFINRLHEFSKIL